MNDVFGHMERWDGEGVVVRHDRPTGTWIFIALHSCRLGPATGGTRMKVYESRADAVLDAQRLGEGMTHKWAGLGMPYGGGKAVLAVPRPLEGAERRGLFERYGDVIRALHGSFRTGADLGTTTPDMTTIAGRCDHVMGFDETAGTAVDPAPYTAWGVLSGLRAGVADAFGTRDLAGRTVLVQGVGSVGSHLTRLLAEAGAVVLTSDIDAARAEALATEVSGRAVAPADVGSTRCDVYAPCAIGATLDAETIPRLACRVVAGSANNQLATADDAGRLHTRGITYVPDYVSNAGGAMAFALMKDGLWEHDALIRRVGELETVVEEILTEARADDVSPAAASRRRVDRALTKGVRPREA